MDKSFSFSLPFLSDWFSFPFHPFSFFLSACDRFLVRFLFLCVLFLFPFSLRLVSGKFSLSLFSFNSAINRPFHYQLACHSYVLTTIGRRLPLPTKLLPYRVIRGRWTHVNTPSTRLFPKPTPISTHYHTRQIGLAGTPWTSQSSSGHKLWNISEKRSVVRASFSGPPPPRPLPPPLSRSDGGV